VFWWLNFDSYVWYTVIIIIMAWNLRRVSVNDRWRPCLSTAHFQTIPGRLYLCIYLRTAIMPTVGDVEWWNTGMLSIFWLSPGQTSMRSWGSAILRNLRSWSFFLEKRGEKKKRPSSHERYMETRPSIRRIYLYPLDDAIDFPMGPVVQTLDSAIHPDKSLSSGWRNLLP